MKIASWVATAFFIFAVVMQYNDPDPWSWIIMYALSAVATLMALFDISYWSAVAVLPFGIALFWLSVFAQSAFQGQTLGVHPAEFYSEVGGSLLVVGWILFLYKNLKKHKFPFFRRHHEEA